MKADAAVIERLNAVSGVTALVGTRIYKSKLAQSPTLPAVVVQLISAPRGHHMRGADGAYRSRVQIDSYVSDSVTDPAGDLEAVSAAIVAALDGKEFTVSGLRVTGAFKVDGRVSYEAEDLRLWREQQDYIVWTK